MLRIGISGSYGGNNLGDEAILQGILQQLRESLSAQVTVFSPNAEDTRTRHAVERVVAVRDLSREEVRPEVAALDLFILGGGGILYDGKTLTYMREVALAHELGVPVFVYAVSVGPLTNPEARKAVREGLNRAAVITVRDRGSQQLLEEIGVTAPVHVTADPALLVGVDPAVDESLAAEGLTPSRRLIGISVREPGEAAPHLDVRHYHQLLANAADFMVDRYDATLVFVPMEPRVLDQQHSHAVIAGMANAPRALVLKREYSVAHVLSMMGHFEFALGMRLHFLIFAALQGVPFLALPYSNKVTGLIREFEMATPPVENLNAGLLVSYVDRAWDLRKDLRTRIATHLPRLQARARQTHELLLELAAKVEGRAESRIA
jgi:polysaccharide pyruvyl transferase CsaB